jgi:hypothetical protein
VHAGGPAGRQADKFKKEERKETEMQIDIADNKNPE